VRLLHVIASVDPRGGGPPEGLRQYCLCAARLGHVFEVASLDPPGATCVEAFPARVHALGPPRTAYWYGAAARPWLDDNVARYDAVLVHGLWSYHVYAAWRACRRARVPHYVFTHGMLDPWFKRRYPLKHLKKWLVWPWADYRALRDAAGVLFTTEEEAHRAPGSFRLYSARPRVVGLGIIAPPPDAARQRESFLAAFPALRGQRFILFLGRIHPVKGCDLALEAFAQAAASDAALRLVIAGPGPAREIAVLRSLAARLAIGARVTWTGMLSGAAKWGALRAAEALILPSHHENFGVAPVEAMACGTPVLVSDKVSIWREIVAAGAGLVAPDTRAGTTRLLRDFLALPSAARRAMGERAIVCFEREFGIERATARLLEALGAEPPAPAPTLAGAS
jgi:glycosyltransferase involved in cell wall biosynthesis